MPTWTAHALARPHQDQLELRKGDRANANVRAWIEKVSSEEIYLSVLVIGELRRDFYRENAT